MKNLGIIAGMGPYASTSFIRRILELTPAPKEWDHIRMLVDYNIHIPSRTRSLLYGEASPAPMMIESIRGLRKAGASMVAIPCNSAHYWYDEVSRELEIPWLNLIEITADAVKEKTAQSVLILGAYVTTENRLYDKYLENTTYLNEKEVNKFLVLIERLKLDESKVEIRHEFARLLSPYADQVDAIVLACTEPSMLFENKEEIFESFAIVDSTHEYAKKCVELFKGVKL